MKHSELERSWPAAEPPPGFADRVLERLQQGSAPVEPVARRGRVLGWLRARRVSWLLLPAAALALGAVLLTGPGPATQGDVIAAEPRVLSIGGRAVAELAAGAHVRWSREGAAQRVVQDSGAVTYRVQPGAEFRVETPHGTVTVLGTVFRVVVAAQQTAELQAAEQGALRGDAMKKQWAIAGAGASVAALLWVSVEQGSVRLSRGREEVVLAAGQAGAIGSDGVPRREREAAEPAPDADAERRRLRQVADTVRRNAARRRAAQEQAAAKQAATTQAPAEPEPPPVEFRLPLPGQGRPPPPEDPEAARRRSYIQRTMREQYFPVARECYSELLGRQPTASGTIMLDYAIVGDADAGVVDRVAIREDGTTITDPEFQLCMTESMYTAVFEPPPPGAQETTVSYPVELRPE